ncbi:MAG: SpoIIE family protein phosphatase [Candidatus Eremiobacteraeota bacterium]|nr:SpoIIE family protein phosphatase [Candidatus Eremiobacteraeota bacterium]
MHKATPLSLKRLEREHRYLDLLVKAGEILSSALDWHETITGVCAAAVETVADICLLDLIDEGGRLDEVAAVHSETELIPILRGAGSFLRDKTRGPAHPVVTVVGTRQPLLVPLVDDDYMRTASTSAEHEQFMRQFRYRSLIVVPLISTTQGIIGALTLVRTDASEDRYDEETLRFAEDLARRCATAIAKARLYERTNEIATVYQRAALPERMPNRDGISFDAFYEPSSEELLVGGDWYDAFDLKDGRIAITVGDVLGHGLDAAVWMSRLRNGLRAALFAEPDPARALEIGDEMLRAERHEEFSSALIALVDPVRQTLSCASAGHPGPLVWDTSGNVTDPFVERGLPLGLRTFGSVAITSQTLTLRPGTFAAFFTDGLLEWNRNIDEAWSRLLSALSRQDVRESLHPAHAIRKHVIGSDRHHDDVAILTVRLEKLVRRSVPQ